MHSNTIHVTPTQVYILIYQIWINIRIWAKLHPSLDRIGVLVA